MGKVLVGRDAIVYHMQGGGLDTNLSGFNASNVIDILGNWKDISVKFTNDWVEVTPSSGELKEKRRTTYDWKATLSNFVRSGGSLAMPLMLNNDYILVIFTEEATGKTMTLIGGIFEAGNDHKKEETMETMEIENVGKYNNGPSIFYN